MRTVHVLQHVDLEGPGRIGEVARDAGFAVELHRLFAGAPVPRGVNRGDVLVVMGGPMGVADRDDARWPFLKHEVALLERAFAEERPVLGVCLGAQLMAHALGAPVFPLVVGEPPVRHREVGWGAVTFSATGTEEPALEGLDGSEVVLHWHGDTFDLPRGAVHLASTLACPNQMFRWGRRSFAVQFHVEISAEEVTSWVRDDGAFVVAANGRGGGDRILEETARYAPRFRRAGDRLLRNIVGLWLEAP
jgi:GMP synthase-like glutamine amidotransferase